MRFKILLLIFISSSLFAVCNIVDVIPTITPNAQWVLNGIDYTGLQWLDKIQTQPTLAQVNQAIANCQANQVQLQAYAVELSTTQAAVAGLADNYVAASVLQQIQINKNMARIIKLRQLLGLQ